MIKFTTLNKNLKRDNEYISSVHFGGYEGNICICVIEFKPLQIVSIDWNTRLIDCINHYILSCPAKLSITSTSKYICITFKVQLS